MSGALNLSVFAANAAVADACARAFTRTPVRVACRSILDSDADALVSPANSFGFMDGGVDAAYLRAFGACLERRVRDAISAHSDLGLLVGEALSVPLGPPGRYLIVAPIMRRPRRLLDAEPAYLATRAAIRAAKGAGWAVAMPGMGTGVGGLDPVEAARAMRQAWDAEFPI